MELQTIADQLLWASFAGVVLLPASLSALLLMELRNQRPFPRHCAEGVEDGVGNAGKEGER